MLLIEAKWILVRPLPGHDSTRYRMEDSRIFWICCAGLSFFLPIGPQYGLSSLPLVENPPR